MRYRLEFDAARRCIIVTTEGDGTAEGIIASMEDTIRHPEWRAGFSVLVDHRKLCLAGIPNAGIENASHRFIELGKNFGSGRCAIVLERDVDFGVARAWEMITADEVAMAIRAFRDMEKAREWIDEGYEPVT